MTKTRQWLLNGHPRGRPIADDDLKPVCLEPLRGRIEIDPDDAGRRAKIATPSFQRATVTNTNLDEGERASPVWREEGLVNREVMGPLDDTMSCGAEVA